MRRIAARDRDALAELYDLHAPAIMGLCLRILHDRFEAEDTVEEVFFELWLRADRYDPERGRPIAYLVTLARSRALDRLRARRRRPGPTADAEVDETPAGPDLGPSSPLEDALAAERRLKIQGLLEALHSTQRTAIELSFFRGLTHREISERLGEPLGTIKTRIRQGLIRLRDALRALDENDA